MINKKILLVTEPIIASNTEHGYLLSGVQTNPLSKEWLMNNFIHQVMHGINMSPDMNFYPIVDHTTCPCIDYLRVSKEMIKERWKSITEFLIDNINKQYYVIVHLDWFYVSNSNMYLDMHYEHPVLVYGYDKCEQKFYIGDFGKSRKFGFSKISFTELEQGFISDNSTRARTFINERYLYIDDVILYRNRATMNYKFDLDMLYNSIEDYLNSTNVSKVYAQGDYAFFSSAVFGLEAIRTMSMIIKKSIAEIEEYSINYKFITVPLERTRLMIERVTYLQQVEKISFKSTMLDEFKELYNMYNVLKNMVIKCNLIQDRTNIACMIELKLQSIVEKEERIYTEFLKNKKL